MSEALLTARGSGNFGRSESDPRVSTARPDPGPRHWRSGAAMTAIVPVEQGTSQPVGYGRPPVATRFRPGRSGNPAGRPTAGASIREYLNVLQDWTVGDLRALAAHPRTGAMKRAAAQMWLAACSCELTPARKPVAGPALDFILMRTSGRPRPADRVATMEVANV